MKTTWSCRDYQSGDEYQILALYKEVNNREMTLEHWKWKFTESPSGRGIIKLMFDGEKLIGHRGAIPMIVSIQGVDTPAAIMVNTLTHPDYQRLGVSTCLADAIYDEARQHGIKFVYNFPNPNSYPLYLEIDDWEMLDKRNAWQKQLRGKSASARSHSSSIKQVKRFDQRVNRLWNRVKQDYAVIVPRTEQFLNWRFTEHPTEEYSKFVVVDKGTEILGYLVLKLYTRGDEVKGHIVDMLCLNDRDIVESLLGYSYNFFIGKEIRNVSCWMPENSFYISALKEEGFVGHITETHFGLRILDKQNNLLPKVRDINNWHLTMSDSDVF